MMRNPLLWSAALAALVGCSDCNNEEEAQTEESTEETPAEEPIRAITPVEVDMKKVELGRRLFHDPILSGDGTISCATCHSLDHGGAEPRTTSNGIRGQTGPINSPTVLNAHFNFVQFWDGRAANLEEQAAGPVENPLEMGATFADVVGYLKADEQYSSAFAEIFGEGDDAVSKENITAVLAEYERYLITPSPVDAYLNGDESALTAQQIRGYETFKEVGCTSCHMGEGVGGSMYQKMGVIENYFELRGGELTEADMGRFNVTQDESDRHFFKVPSLRNVAITGPYFHDGSQSELGEAVKIMAKVQLGKELTDAQVNDIVAFLNALTGDLPEHARLPEDDVIPDRRRDAGESEGEGEEAAATEDG